MGIDMAILSLASWLNVSWMSMLAPLKYASKELAKKIFAATIAPLLVGMTCVLAKVIVPVLTFVGVSALAAAFNVGVTGTLALFKAEPWRAVLAIASIGGFIASIVD